MPTRSDFETAAEMFTTAAGLIDELAASAESADASQILRGGSLGRQVPERIAAAAQSAAYCHQQVVQAAETCLERAAIIADYEWRLEMYDRSYYYYDRASRAWAAQFSAWFLDETDTVVHPGDVPQPPTKPTPPGDWAEVRRS